MSRAGRVDDARLLELDPLRAEALEQPDASAEEDRADVAARLHALAVRSGLGIVAAALLALWLTACGNDEQPRPPGPLAAALSEIGGGGEHGSLGVGWTDPQLAREAGVGAGLMATALGPNAETFVQAAPRLRRRFEFDPLSAQRLVSVGGSYAFGLRLDGVDGRGLRDALVRAGGQTREGGDIDLVDVGDYAEVPAPLVPLGVLGLGARDAFGPTLTVLAISETSRAALLGRGGRLIDQPVYRAAADCLGNVVAARMIPDKLLLSTEVGIELIAAGIRGDREVLCVLGGTAERAREVATALRASLTPDARDPRTGQPISGRVSEVQVGTSSYEGVNVARAELTSAPGERGFLFGTIARGSLVPMINGS
jgi:hypothetical protein